MLKGKTAVVTGGVRGIGKAIAKIFCENGANVVLCYRSNDAEAEKTAAELGAFGTQVRVVKGDVADPETAKKVAELIKTDFDKKVDILVNNAGITNDKLMMRMDAEDFTKVINANLNGAFYMMKELSALMVKKRSGVIINMASVSGLKGNPAQVNYSASKAGVVGMTLSAAKELGRRGIKVNAIAPGFLVTNQNRALLFNEDGTPTARSAKILNGTPTHRFVDSEELIGGTFFLCDDKAESAVTGVVLPIDAGFAAYSGV